ncbi:MAG: bifunctional demethylmenaquinone methyltransferase/2-methoxy-6-polyprenyl-1,4-benzoquinol methylase UbiE [Planctomycetes bacterium]|nr:bifunctional demethylmenaquinone methyltransferase/2-methoxy-6-polyprenyl-1,4-benzoquinol methylase UbiE [Planctomycetota bacterium]
MRLQRIRIFSRVLSVEAQSISVDKSGDRVRRMFAEIAPRYDLLNHVLSLNIDRYWRWRTLRILGLKPGEPVLDVCTGTGDLALSASKRLGGSTEVVGTDFCAEMLEIARQKQSKNLPTHGHLRFLEADTMRLPFDGSAFQTVMVAFGLRNVSDTDAGVLEMMRVCKPGGQLAILEFSKPTWPILKQGYDFYFRHVLPRIGNSVARNSSDAYRYLPESVIEFPSGKQLADRLRASGLQDVRWIPMTMGVVTLYIGRKPAQ